MPEETTTTDDAATEPPAQATEPEDTTDWKAEARKWEQRAKENKQSAAELERQRKASMSEAEKAIADAETRGAQTATERFGARLVRTEFDAAAGRRNPDFDTASALEYVDLKKFIGEDGEPDTKAIKAAVERLVPAPASGPPSYDGGSRGGGAKSGDMNDIIRKAAGLG